MSEDRKIAICIGVGQAGKPRRLPYLAGAINGARDFNAWANKFGYRSTLLTDEKAPVTLARLRSEIESALGDKTIYRMILYFAGHGLIREIENGLWLLSDWDVELRAVAVERLRRRLLMYDIKQISIFADACRSIPPDVQALDLAEDPVLGRGPSLQSTSTAIDKFVAAQDGSETSMVPGNTPEEDRCIFSGVLLEGLWGTKKEAFSKLLPTVITSRSLAAYLQSEVPKVAALYNRNLKPSVIPSFPEGTDIYFDGGNTIVPPIFPAWPPIKPVLPMSPEPDMGFVLHSISPDDGDFNLSFEAKFSPKDTGREQRPSKQVAAKPAPKLLDQLRRQLRPHSFETESGFAVSGASVEAIWARADVYGRQHGEPGWWRVGNSPLKQASPVLIEFTNELFAAVTALPGFIASIVCDENGASALIYRKVYSPETSAAAAERAISELEGGRLRADTATNFAVELRRSKHADPVLGVISAYLYDSINDVDSIRRMAYYYIQNGQPIPYDIALLARVEAEWRDDLLWVDVPAVEQRKPRTDDERNFFWTHKSTPSKQGVVGGLWPWMRQGWASLEDYREDGSKLVSPSLPDLLPHLRKARFTTFDAEGAHKLANIFMLVRSIGGDGLSETTKPKRREKRVDTKRVKANKSEKASKRKAAKKVVKKSAAKKVKAKKSKRVVKKKAAKKVVKNAASEKVKKKSGKPARKKLAKLA
jgi:hypothetical protein